MNSAVSEGEVIRLDGHKYPDGGRSYYVNHKGVRLRAFILFPGRSDRYPEPRGSVILVPGRTEFIEKYFETAEDFRARGFCVMTVDHRGQGLSDRLLPNAMKSWVGSFDDYVTDLAFVTQSLSEHLPRPHVLVGHSMGGAIGLQGLISGHLPVDAAVFNAPMLGLYGLNKLPISLTIKALALMGFAKRRLPKQPKPEGIPVPFTGNKLTSDESRYTRWRAYFDSAPRLRLAGPTYGWIRAGMSAMRYINRNAQQLKTPTLIVQTSKDPIVIPSIVEDFARRAECEFLMIDGALHETFLEQDMYRQTFFEAFDKFCERQAV